MLNIFKKMIPTLGLIGLMTTCAWTADAQDNFVVTPIAENVYSIISPSLGLPTPENKGWNSNSHFVVTEEGVLVFDTGSSESIGNKIKDAIKTITDQPVRWVVNSHSHADHWLGNAAFVDTGAEIITSNHALATMKMDGPGAVAFYARVSKGATGPTELVYPTSILTQNQKRIFGGVAVEFIFANDGHSPGDLLMWLPKQQIILGGDVLSSDWMPIITGHGNVPNLISTLHDVVALNPAIVLPGHGKPTTVKSVKRDVDILSSVWKQVEADFKNNKTPEETILDVKAKLGPKYSPLYLDFETEIERHVKLMYSFQQ
jgi:glyoxylase-like metal-dependent hydrolase (beta-lactamase superfamily II)